MLTYTLQLKYMTSECKFLKFRTPGILKPFSAPVTALCCLPRSEGRVPDPSDFSSVGVYIGSLATYTHKHTYYIHTFTHIDIYTHIQIHTHTHTRMSAFCHTTNIILLKLRPSRIFHHRTLCRCSSAPQPTLLLPS